MADEDTETYCKRKIAALKVELCDEEDVWRASLRQAIVSWSKVETLRAELKHYENNLQVRPSYISILSDDILRLIMQHLVDSPDEYRSYRLLKLSHVSMHWRALAIGTPSLWAMNIFVRYTRSDNLLNLYLERSQQSLLKIRISFSPREELGVQLAGTLSRCIQRCRILEVYIPRQRTPSFEWMTDLHAPFLEDLVLASDPLNDPLSPWILPLLRGGTPMLKSLELGAISSTCHIAFNPKILTSLLLSYDLLSRASQEMEFHSLRTPLQELPFLSSLMLEEMPLYLRVPEEPIAIELGCLRFLRFAPKPLYGTYPDNRRTLSLIRAPLLNHLEISFGKQSDSMIEEYFSTYLQEDPPTYPELHTLTLHNAFNIMPAAASAFCAITSLEVIDHITDIRDIFESSDGRVYWKCLQKLVLRSPHIDFRKLASTIWKRKKIGYPVDKVELELTAIEWNDPKQPEDWLHMQIRDVDNSLTCGEVLELYMSLYTT